MVDALVLPARLRPREYTVGLERHGADPMVDPWALTTIRR